MQQSCDEDCMKIALMEAQEAFAANEVPIGAIIIDQNNNVVSSAHNLTETLSDATAHAEILAIRAAAKKLKRKYLTDCTLYVTVEPCPMCAGALVMSRVERLVYGVADIKAGACESIFNVVNNPAMNHRLKVTAGVLEDECAEILRRFFGMRRQKAQ